MADHCAPTFEALAESMGFSCDAIGGLVSLRNPLALSNWTMPVLEVTVITGAVLALLYAISRYRVQRDPTNLVLWFGAIAYLLIIEPPLYFPAAFGIDGHIDTMFAHNLFTVDFLWGRLPLYIVAIYPMMATVAFELVRCLGVFRRYGTVIGAVCVGFVHHAFYEVFDHLGPQLRWWEWTADHPLNQPFFASVPTGSVVVFAALWPTSLAFCVQWLVGRRADVNYGFTGLEVAWRTVAVGLLASLGTVILPLPATVVGALTDNVTAVGVTYYAELAGVALLAAPVLWRQAHRLRSHSGTASDEPRHDNPLIVGYAASYLIVMIVLWISAMPDYFHAVDGVTAGGDPIGSLWYAAVCFTVAGWCVGSVSAVDRTGMLDPANR